MASTLPRKTLLALTTALLSSGLSFVAPPTTANAGGGRRAARAMCAAAGQTFGRQYQVRERADLGPQFSNFTGGAPSAAKVPISYDDHGHG